MIKKKAEKPVEIPLRNWHKLPDGTVVDKAYEGCIDYYRREEITGENTCHSFCVDGKCIEESEGKPCCLIRYKPGYKSDKIRYIYFKLSEQESIAIENRLHFPTVGSPLPNTLQEN